MSRLVGQIEAEDIISEFLPMFEYLNEHEVPYCVVGGLGVMLHAYADEGEDRYRATQDADIMFDEDFSNVDFANAYLETYAANPDFSKNIYDAVFGYDAFENLEKDDQAFVNTSFVGAVMKLDGIDTPSFDVVRFLNAKKLPDLEKTTLTIEGVPIVVATVAQLAEMKQSTINTIRVGYADSPRPQDFEDLAQLRRIAGRR